MTLIEQSSTMRTPWTEIVEAKRSVRDAQVEKHRHRSKNIHRDTRSTDVADVQVLTESIQRGEVSAEDIVRAYIDNLITPHLTATQSLRGTRKGPLHGVVMSVKDQFTIEGLDSTLGYVGRAFAPATSDALLVHVLKRLGTVIIAKTNLPQSIMCETENPLWGLTTHPLDANLTPGGSSGGEGALLALHGSMIGWGTDIGGSIRIPSHINGLWGLKPSDGRMSYQGVAVSLDGQQHVPSAVGPMARSLVSLTSVTKAVIDAELWTMDAQLPPLPWREDVFKTFSQRPLVVGTMLDDGMVRVHPPIERVFRETVSRLRAAGHEVVDWDTTLNAECIAIMDAYYTADGGEDIRRAVTEGGEPFLPHIQALIDRAPPISVYDYWQLNKRKVTVQQAYLDLWNSIRSPSGRPVDILLVPTMPHTAVPHRSCRWVGYTKLFNILDYTSLSFPAGKVSKQLDEGGVLKSYDPRNSLDAWNWELYDLEKMDGHDIGLQIVGRRFEEEKVLGAATQIERILKAT
ncbi:amidase [Macrophomina phaseolina]|uniref:amidase n=1 Tax=Macrophomina phaseolina TaxID=35725 RepID=A0ABQ8FP87_9PEZI|nr:amidase [Macrophomina phaseolina]